MDLAQGRCSLNGKRLELLKETVPGLSRVAALWKPVGGGAPRMLDITKIAAQRLRLELHPVEVREPGELEGAFRTAIAARDRALIVQPDPLFWTLRARVAELALKHRLPAIYFDKVFVEAAGLLSYGPSINEIWRRAAIFVDRILKGAKPADLPVEEPTKFELVVNLRAFIGSLALGTLAGLRAARGGSHEHGSTDT